MSDWKEASETQETKTRPEAGEKWKSERLEQSVRGQVDDDSQSDDDLITIHPRKNLETLPSPEVEPLTVRNPEGTKEDLETEGEGTEGSMKGPEGWRPGGPERGY
jgi:hypothetical protein